MDALLELNKMTSHSRDGVEANLYPEFGSFGSNTLLWVLHPVILVQ